MDWVWWEVVGGLPSLWSQCFDLSEAWLELSWHSMAQERADDSGRAEEDAHLRRTKTGPWGHMGNRWKALKHFW